MARTLGRQYSAAVSNARENFDAIQRMRAAYVNSFPCVTLPPPPRSTTLTLIRRNVRPGYAWDAFKLPRTLPFSFSELNCTARFVGDPEYPYVSRPEGTRHIVCDDDMAGLAAILDAQTQCATPQSCPGSPVSSQHVFDLPLTNKRRYNTEEKPAGAGVSPLPVCGDDESGATRKTVSGRSAVVMESAGARFTGFVADAFDYSFPLHATLGGCVLMQC